MPDDTVRARLARLHELVKDPDEVTFLCCELDKTNAAIERLRGEIAERQQTDLGPEIEIILNKHALDLYETDPAPAESDAAPEGGGWIDWHGGACPVADDARVEPRYRNGHVSNARAAGSLVWSHYGYTADVIAYRVVLAAPSPEITPAMIEAGKGIEIDGLPGCLDHDELSAIYRAMRAMEAK